MNLLRRIVRSLFWNKRFRIFLWKCDILPASIHELRITRDAAIGRWNFYHKTGNLLEEQFHQGIALSFEELLDKHTPKHPPEGIPAVQ